MEVRKVKSFKRANGFCANRCLEGQNAGVSSTGVRAATHVVTVCDRDLELCSECARLWQQIWDAKGKAS